MKFKKGDRVLHWDREKTILRIVSCSLCHLPMAHFTDGGHGHVFALELISRIEPGEQMEFAFMGDSII